MAIYMLSLVLMPCSDNCDTDSHNFPLTIQTAQEHHEQDNDMCSPFCICTCCATSISITQYQTDLFTLAYSPETFPSYEESGYSAFAADFWQPPRLS